MLYRLGWPRGEAIGRCKELMGFAKAGDSVGMGLVGRAGGSHARSLGVGPKKLLEIEVRPPKWMKIIEKTWKIIEHH